MEAIGSRQDTAYLYLYHANTTKLFKLQGNLQWDLSTFYEDRVTRHKASNRYMSNEFQKGNLHRERQLHSQ